MNTLSDHTGFPLKGLMEAYQATGIAKAPAVSDYLVDWLAGSSGKIVVFGHHKAVLDCFEGVLNRQKHVFIRLDGSVPAAVRHQRVRQFQTSSDCRVALLSVTAAGVGLTLTAASTVLFAELHWTPGVLQQAEDRVHRIGQKAQQCHILYALHNRPDYSLDPLLCKMLGRKTNTLNQVVDGERSRLAFLPGAGSDDCSEGPPQVGDAGGHAASRGVEDDVVAFFANQAKAPQVAVKPVTRGTIESFFKTPAKKAPASQAASAVTASLPSSKRKTLLVDDNDDDIIECDVMDVESARKPEASTNNVQWSCSSCTYENTRPVNKHKYYTCEMCSRVYSPSVARKNNLASISPAADVKSTAGRKRKNHDIVVLGSQLKRKSDDQNVVVLDDDADAKPRSCKRKSSVIGEVPSPTQPQVIEIVNVPEDEVMSEAEKRADTARFAFSVSKHSSRITIHHCQEKKFVSLLVNFDMDQILSTETKDELLSIQTQRGGVSRGLKIIFDGSGVREVIASVASKNVNAGNLGREIKSFVSAYLRLREVEKKMLKEMGSAVPAGDVAQTVANLVLSQSSIHGTAERYAGGAKERALAKQNAGSSLTQAEANLLDGKACAWCGKDLDRSQLRAKATYCSEECAEQGRLRRGGRYASGNIRAAMFALEGGKCCLCGINAHQLFSQIQALEPAERLNRLLDVQWKLPNTSKALENLLQRPKEGDFWQIDHIQAVAQGGGDCVLDNLRTLCVPCHLKETQKLTVKLKLQGASSAEEHGAQGQKCKQMNMSDFFRVGITKQSST